MFVSLTNIFTVYNNPKATNLKNWFDVIAARVTIKGFLLRDYLKRAKEGTKALEEAIKDGKLDMKGVEEVHEVAFEEVPRYVLASINLRCFVILI